MSKLETVRNRVRTTSDRLRCTWRQAEAWLNENGPEAQITKQLEKRLPLPQKGDGMSLGTYVLLGVTGGACIVAALAAGHVFASALLSTTMFSSASLSYMVASNPHFHVYHEDARTAFRIMFFILPTVLLIGNAQGMAAAFKRTAEIGKVFSWLLRGYHAIVGSLRAKKVFQTVKRVIEKLASFPWRRSNARQSEG